MNKAHTQFDPKTTLAPSIGPRHISAQGILQPQQYFDPLPTSAWKYFGWNNFGPIHFGPRCQFSKMSFWTFRAKVISLTFKTNIFNQALFLIWNYLPCNNSFKFVILMATNLLLEKIILLKIKSIFPSYIISKVHGLIIDIISIIFIQQHFQSRHIF